MDKEIKSDEMLAVDSRKEFLKSSIMDCHSKFNRKSELLKSRRNTIAQVEEFEYEDKSLVLPDIVKKEDHLINLLPDVTNVASAKKLESKFKKKRDSRYEERPSTNYKTISPNPRKTFEKVGKKLNKNSIYEAVENHEQIDKCNELSKTLELYSTKKIGDVPGLKKSFISSIKNRKKTLDGLRDPNFVPNQKFVDNSKILQLAFLDKIIEECDDDLT